MNDPLSWAKVPDVTGPEGFAIKAMARGEATAEQQKTAWDFILRRACRIDELSFVVDAHGGERASAFVEGRRAVGIALRTIAELPSDKLREKDE